jgi:SAM-dependent methyltransferase
MLKRIVSRDFREAYRFRAGRFSDPAMMTGRDAATTLYKIRAIVERLRLQPTSTVLDVGPGDGTLFRMIGPRVKRCCGVDPSREAIEKLRQLFADQGNVEFREGSSESIPYADAFFDVVVMNGVILILSSRQEVARTLKEMARVCRVGGTVFVGEVPFRPEGPGRLPARVLKVVADHGFWRTLALAWRMHLRPLARREPLLLEPKDKVLHFSHVDFVKMCEENGFRVEVTRHQELRRPSTSRNDYLLTRQHPGST